MKLVPWVNAVVLISCSATLARGQATISQSAARTQTISREPYKLVFPPPIEKDAGEIERLADLTMGELSQTFADWDAGTLLKTANLVIVLHDVPTPDANVGTATIHTEEHAGEYSARLDLLAPSLHPENAKTVVGDPKDEIYFHHVLLHEISTVIYERVSLGKRNGWRLHSAPNWFVQGLEQYTAFRLVPERPSLQKYIQRVRSDTNIVQTGSGLTVTEPYLGGTVLVAFMEQKYGFDGLKRLITSPQSTFEEALREELHLSIEGLAEEFSGWIKVQ